MFVIIERNSFSNIRLDWALISRLDWIGSNEVHAHGLVLYHNLVYFGLFRYISLLTEFWFSNT